MDPKNLALPPRKGSFLKKFLLLLSILLLAGLAVWGVNSYLLKKRLKDRPPGLESTAFRPLPLGSVKPLGWLRSQLVLQASGLTGHLDEFWPDVAQSGWIGGKAEGWERMPYWLDGAIPLAYELDDPALLRKVRRCVDYILDHQHPDGWLGPDKSPPASGLVNGHPPEPRDPWPQFIILKDLQQYAEASGDERVLPALKKDLSILSLQLDSRRLFAWNFFRWGELLGDIAWVYERDPDPRWIGLAFKAANQGYNWPDHLKDLPPHAKGRIPGWDWQGHVVNNAMGLKTPALLYRFTGDPQYRMTGTKALAQLDRYHGQPNGLFSGDECLAGRSPSQGTELCAVVEMMFSLETTLSLLGDPRDADRLEKVAYNALPGTISPDYWQHQYVQQANQVACVAVPDPIFASVEGEANLFGLEPHYGCCTANMHQGWPKFVSHLWMATPGGGLAAVAYGPSRVKAQLPSGEVEVELSTEYPFRGLLEFTVHCEAPRTFPLLLRIPAWAKKAVLKLPDGTLENPKAGTFHRVARTWKEGDRLVLELPMEPAFHKGYNDSVSVERGPLVFSLGLKEKWVPFQPFPFQTKDEKRYDYQVVPESPWNYALSLKPAPGGTVLGTQESGLKGNPYTLEGAPVRVTVKGSRLESWRIRQGAAEAPPKSPVESASALEDLVLVPYGAARLRVTDFPVLK